LPCAAASAPRSSRNRGFFCLLAFVRLLRPPIGVLSRQQSRCCTRAREPQGKSVGKGFSLVREGQAQIAPSFSPSRFKSRDTHQWLAVNFDLLGRRSVVRLLSFFRREDRPKRRTTAPLQPDRWPHLRRRSDLRPHHGAVRRQASTLTRCR